METLEKKPKVSNSTFSITDTFNKKNNDLSQIQKNINEMLTLEMESFYLYTTLEIYLYHKGLNGMASWAKIQANEELEHFNQHIEYAKTKRITITLPTLTEAAPLFNTPLEAFKKALEQEIKLGNYYNTLDLQSISVNNYSFSNHLNKFVHEQDEEISLLDNIVNRMTIAGYEAGLILLDQELGKRNP